MKKIPTNQVRSSERGLAGVAALIIFIAIVLVGAITAAVILDVTGSLEQQAAQTGEDASKQISSTLQILDRNGVVESSQSSLSQVSFVVSVAPGTPSLNLANFTVSVTHDNGRSDIVFDGNEPGSGTNLDRSGFHVDTIVSDGQNTIISGPQERYNLTIPDQVTDAVGSPSDLQYESNERIEFVFTSSQGGQAFQEIRVPATLVNDQTVTL